MRSSMLSKSARKDVLAYVDALLDTDTRRLVNVATYDLYYGPTGAYEPDGDGWEYPGFETACERIRAALPASITLYVDEDDCVSDVEPAGYWIDWEANDEDDEEDIPREWVEPEPYYEVDARKEYLGKLSEYL